MANLIPGEPKPPAELAELCLESLGEELTAHASDRAPIDLSRRVAGLDMGSGPDRQVETLYFNGKPITRRQAIALDLNDFAKAQVTPVPPDKPEYYECYSRRMTAEELAKSSFGDGLAAFLSDAGRERVNVRDATSYLTEAETKKILEECRAAGYEMLPTGVTLTVLSEPTRESLEIAARVWQDQDMQHVAMDTNAATLIASILDTVRGVHGTGEKPDGDSQVVRYRRRVKMGDDVATPTIIESSPS